MTLKMKIEIALILLKTTKYGQFKNKS